MEINSTTSKLKIQNLQTKTEQEPKENSYKCNECRDTGYIITPQEHSQPLMTPCKCIESDKVKKFWRNSGINTDNLEKSFKNFETWSTKSTEMKDTATNYFLRFEKIKASRINSILLCGNPGSGKTHIALALANNLLKKNIRVIYMPYRDIVTSLKQNMIDEEYYKKTLSRYQTCDVLLLDDLYKGKVNDSDINIMFELINYRYLNQLPIIVSTEFTIEKLLSFDEAIGSRIYEMSKGYTVEISGTENNYRLR
jgi:DNA replication protein DnaC